MTRANVPAELPSLTGLRWPAALVVFGLHLHVIGYFSPGVGATVVAALFGAGSVGVSFFFILSGFILMWATPAAVSWRQFWWRRAVRIYPLHLTTAALALALTVTADRIGPPPAIIISNVTLLHSWLPDIDHVQSLNTVSWSLSCEAFFYLAFPALSEALTRCARRGALALAGSAVTLVTTAPWLAGLVADGTAVRWFVHWTPVGRLPEFVFGMALARLVILGAWPRCLNRVTTLPCAAGLTVLGYVVASLAPVTYRYASCTAMCFGLLIVAAARADLGGAPSPWRRRSVVRLGEWSFAFYLVHLLLVRGLEAVIGRHPQLPDGQAVVLSAVLLCSSMALAWILYAVVEVPARRWLLRLTAQKRPERTGSSPGPSVRRFADAHRTDASAIVDDVVRLKHAP